MSTPAVIGIGSTLSIDESGGGTDPTLIAYIEKYKFPGKKTAGINITNNDSPGAQEYLPGVPDGGDATFDLIYSAAACALLYTLSTTILYTWIFTLADGHNFTFTGFLTNLEGDGSTQTANKLKIAIKLTGLPTYNTSTPL